MKSFRQTHAYKLIRNSGFKIKEIAPITKFSTPRKLREHACHGTSTYLINEIQRAIETLHNNKNNPVGHLPVKFRIGEEVFYIESFKAKIFIRKICVLGLCILNRFQKDDILYLCSPFSILDGKFQYNTSENRFFYDNEIFHTINAAKEHLQKCQIIEDVD